MPLPARMHCPYLGAEDWHTSRTVAGGKHRRKFQFCASDPALFLIFWWTLFFISTLQALHRCWILGFWHQKV